MKNRNHIVANVCSGIILYTLSDFIIGVESNFSLPSTYFKINISMIQNFLIKLREYLFGFDDFYLLICLLLFLLGSVLPDIDSPTSVLGRYVHLPIEHRTWTHTAYALIPLVGLSILFRPCIWLFLGYFGHLFWDSFSRGGICWFNPVTGYLLYPNGAKIKKGHYKYLYRVGDISETIIVFLLMLTSGFLFYNWIKISNL